MSIEHRDKLPKRQNTVALSDRTQLVIEGVQHVNNFDDDTISLSTDMGMLTIRGHNLRINQLDLDVGHFSAEGDFDAFVYSRKNVRNKSSTTWKKMWR